MILLCMTLDTAENEQKTFIHLEVIAAKKAEAASAASASGALATSTKMLHGLKQGALRSNPFSKSASNLKEEEETNKQKKKRKSVVGLNSDQMKLQRQIDSGTSGIYFYCIAFYPVSPQAKKAGITF